MKGFFLLKKKYEIIFVLMFQTFFRCFLLVSLKKQTLFGKDVVDLEMKQL